MSPFHSIILGIVEGFSEFLPISSTAHLGLASFILGIDQDNFVKTFEIVIQGGAILAVFILYWRKFTDINILKKVITAFIPTAIVGFILYKIIKSYLIGNIYITVISLFLGGIILIVYERFIKRDITQDKDIHSIDYKTSIYLGLIQAIAIIPGVSRSGATIVGGRFLGLSKKAIVEFSFLLGGPTILAATGYDLLKNYKLFDINQVYSLSTGFFFSFITAIIGIKFLLKYIENNSLRNFGIYRIIISIIFFIIVFF